MDGMFVDRRHAGRELAAELARRAYADPVVLALPRGGVPVAAEVARALHAPLDLLLVRKIGAPANPELAVAAIAEGAQHPVLDQETLAMTGATPAYVEREAKAQLQEIARRRRAYLQDRPPASVAGRTVIVVDDGIATGTTARAALRALRSRGAARVVLAVPVAPPESVQDLQAEADEIVCLSQPEFFGAVGSFYADFHQVGDEEVVAALASASSPTGARHPSRH